MSPAWFIVGGVVAAGVVGTACVGALHPASGLFGAVTSKGPSDSPRVALTFDDGPDPEFTPRILDILLRCGVKASFFVIGSNVRRWPGVVRRAEAEGHLIANHSFDHSRLGMFRSGSYWEDQLRRTGEALEDTIGHRSRLFRPPMGFKQPWITAAAARGGYRTITWTRRARDGRPITPEQILKRLATTTRGGDILLLHDGHEPGRERSQLPTVAALDPLIAALLGRGLQPVRVDQLLGI